MPWQKSLRRAIFIKTGCIVGRIVREYREVVLQTQRVMEESVKEEHRLLRMRARPKILVAETYEEAKALYGDYRPYIISVISDIRFPRNGNMDAAAGVALLKMIQKESPDIALLNLSSDDAYRNSVLSIPAAFIRHIWCPIYMSTFRFGLKHFPVP
jgi:hypothetical protein